MKTVFDFLVALLLVIVLSPLLIIVSCLIWRQDKINPFYVASRVGKNGNLFNMIKFRSMIKDADKTSVDSTSVNDLRITMIGHFIRKYKIDEIPNVFNVLRGQMSFVGPRANVRRETDLYTAREELLLSVKPGITDFSSVVFSDESEILGNSQDADLDYNQLIRPWKSRLGIVYVQNHTFIMDLEIMIATVISLVSKERGLVSVYKLVSKNCEDQELLNVIQRKHDLTPYPPPGSNAIVSSRN